VPAESPETAVPRILELVKTRIPKRFGLDPIRDIQVLCPDEPGWRRRTLAQYRTPGGTEPSCRRPEGRAVGWTFAPGDKVMQIENDYDKEVYNGDIGYIVDVIPEEKELAAKFDGRTVIYGFDELDSRLCRNHPQKPEFGRSGRSYSGHDGPLCHATQKCTLHWRHPRQKAGRSGRSEEDHCHRGSQRGGAPALVQAQRVAGIEEI
jgi:hypothetical protein